MSLTNKIFILDPNSSLVKSLRFLFILWFLTLPFGSNLFNISIGFLTIYPNLILTIILLPFSLITLKKWYFTEIFLCSFLFIWTFFSLVAAINTGFSSDVIFYIRSLVMQVSVATLLIGNFHLLGRQNLNKIIVTGLRCFLFILLFSGIIEFITGIHFAGNKTSELLDLPVGNTFYAPMFIYDNQNDFLAYLILIFLLMKLIDEKFRNNLYLQLTITLVTYCFSIYADSNFAKIISGGAILFILFEILKANYKKEVLKSSLPYLLVVFFLIVTVVSNRLFFGPKYQNGANYRLNGISLIEEKNNKLKVVSAKESLTKAKQEKVIQYLDSVNTKSPEGTSNIRKNLIYNGIDFIKSAPILGIGPGGFANKLKHNKQNYYVHTQISPHNFPIEIISQSGIFGWIYFAFLAYLLFQFLILYRNISFEFKTALLILVLALPLIWMMPSAFLYLNIHWLFLPLLLIQLKQVQEKPNLDDIKQ